MSKLSLVIVGGGNMGAALARGLVAHKFLQPNELGIVESNDERRVVLRRDFPQSEISEKMLQCESVIVAVKPGDVFQVCSTLNNFGVKQLLSIAAGVTIASLESACDGSISVVRAMPNTPALIGQGASAMSASEKCTSDQTSWAKKILLSVGKVVEVEESLLDAVTGLTGSGPAYIFLFAEALIAAGVQQGLPDEVANDLVRQLLVGASELLAQSDASPAELRRNVTSANGTTAAGIAALEGQKFSEIVAAAVQAATTRSKQLGK